MMHVCRCVSSMCAELLEHRQHVSSEPFSPLLCIQSGDDEPAGAAADAAAVAGAAAGGERGAEGGVGGRGADDWERLESLHTLQNLSNLQNLQSQHQLLQSLPPGALSALTGTL